MKQIKDYLCNLPFWGKLTDYERELLRNNAYLRRFEKGSYVFSPKDEDDFGMMVLLRGQIRAHMLSEDGREVTLFSLCDGSICVFSAASLFKQLTFRVFLSAERSCEALVINMALLEKLTHKNIYFRCFVYELIAERFSWVMDSMQWILFHGLEKRLAFFWFASMISMGKAFFTVHTSSLQKISVPVARGCLKRSRVFRRRVLFCAARAALKWSILPACARLPTRPTFSSRRLPMPLPEIPEKADPATERRIP